MRKAVENTKILFENVNWKMALRYISKAAESDDQVKEWGFEEWCPVRTKTGNARPGMTGCSEIDDKWTEGVIPNDEINRKKVLGKVLEIAVIKVFRSSFCSFQGKTYLQKDGSPIGCELSGEVSRVVMGFWDVKYKDLCENNCIKKDLDLRYVDDKNQGLGSIPQGYRWTVENLDFKEEWRLDWKMTIEHANYSVVWPTQLTL